MTKLTFSPVFHSLCADGPLAGSWVVSGLAGFQNSESAVRAEAARIVAAGGSVGYVDSKFEHLPAPHKQPLLLPFYPTPSQAFPVMMDEFGYYIGQSDDTLKEELRGIDGIPNATYLVDDNRVFVFGKLVHLVKSTAGVLELEGEARRCAVRDLCAQAWVSPTEAVAEWDVVPVPYEVRVDGSWRSIVHRPFSARIPQRFATQEALQEALSLLLIGGVVAGEEQPDFVYAQQGFKLVESFSADSLPPRPTFPASLDDAASSGGAWRLPQPFVAGFTPVNQGQYDHIATLATSWRAATRAAQDAVARADGLWGLATAFPLASLNDVHRNPEIEIAEDVAALRELYPELTVLSDTELYARFDWYQSECCYINGWDASRDDEFLLYLIGCLAPGELGGDGAKELGSIAAFAALNGAGVEGALKFGRAWQEYHGAICRLESRMSDAMRFLARQQEAKDLRGGRVRTLNDLFTLGRSMSFAAIPVMQSLDGLTSAATNAAQGEASL